MKARFSAFLGGAAAATISLTALAQVSSQPAGQSSTTTTAQQERQITVVGCVQSESAYRRAQDAGRGGVAGTGIGAGNEFVLVNASVSGGGVTDTTFELTGSNEGQVKSHVGKRVEITGTLKAADTAAGRPTGGPTAGRPPEGVDVASKDLRLRELEVSSVREASGTCPPQ